MILQLMKSKLYYINKKERCTIINVSQTTLN